MACAGLQGLLGLLGGTTTRAQQAWRWEWVFGLLGIQALGACKGLHPQGTPPTASIRANVGKDCPGILDEV